MFCSVKLGGWGNAFRENRAFPCIFVHWKERARSVVRAGGLSEMVGGVCAHFVPLQDRAAVRLWDLMRAAKAEKVGFWADIGGYFFIFGLGGRCARGMTCSCN